MALPKFKKITLDGTMFNKEIHQENKYFCKLKPIIIKDGSGHQIDRNWHTGRFNVYENHCVFMCNEYINVPLTEIDEVYRILEST